MGARFRTGVDARTVYTLQQVSEEVRRFMSSRSPLPFPIRFDPTSVTSASSPIDPHAPHQRTFTSDSLCAYQMNNTWLASRRAVGAWTFINLMHRSEKDQKRISIIESQSTHRRVNIMRLAGALTCLQGGCCRDRR